MSSLDYNIHIYDDAEKIIFRISIGILIIQNIISTLTAVSHKQIGSTSLECVKILYKDRRIHFPEMFALIFKIFSISKNRA